MAGPLPGPVPWLPFWATALAPGEVTIDALRCRSAAADRIDFRELGVPVTIIATDAGEERVAVGLPGACFFLRVGEGTVRNGSVLPRYRIEGLARLEEQLLTLRRLVALCRLGRLPGSLFLPERRAARWVELLRAHDARRSGARYRELAVALYGAQAVASEWRGASDFMRLRVQRMMREAERLVGGGYRALLAG